MNILGRPGVSTAAAAAAKVEQERREHKTGRRVHVPHLSVQSGERAFDLLANQLQQFATETDALRLARAD